VTAPARSQASRPHLGSRRLALGPRRASLRPCLSSPMRRNGSHCPAPTRELTAGGGDSSHAQPVLRRLTDRSPGPRGRRALERVERFDPFAARMLKSCRPSRSSCEGDRGGPVLRGYTALFTPPLPTPLRPRGEHHTEGSPDCRRASPTSGASPALRGDPSAQSCAGNLGQYEPRTSRLSGRDANEACLLQGPTPRRMIPAE